MTSGRKMSSRERGHDEQVEKGILDPFKVLLVVRFLPEFRPVY